MAALAVVVRSGPVLVMVLPPPRARCASLCSRRLLANGNHQLGYDIGTIASAGLLATAVPAARATGDAYSVAMSALGGEPGDRLRPYSPLQRLLLATMR